MSFETNEKKPVIEFIADETKRASGLYGPQTILSDLTEIAKMFDPNSVHGDNETKGGIWEENFSEELKNKYTVLLEKMHTHEYDEEPFENSEALVKSGKLFEFFKKYATLKYLEENYYDKDVIEDSFNNCDEQIEKRVTLEKLTEILNAYETIEQADIFGQNVDKMFAQRDENIQNLATETQSKATELDEKIDSKTEELKTETENVKALNEELGNDIEKLQYYGTKDIEISPVSWFRYDGTTLTVTTQYNYNVDMVIPYIFTGIGERGAAGLSNLKRIVLPNTITSIGNYAFRNNSDLTSINIPDSVTTIGLRAFENDSGLTSITIPESVTGLGDYVFDGCSGLASVTILSNKFDVNDNTFSGVGQDTVFYIEQGTKVEEQLKSMGCNYKYIKVSAEAYATQKELENYVKKDDYSGINSLAYFFADNLNNGLFGKIETSGALMCDYIFKNNSMSEIEIDLSNCYSMVGGFLNSTVEKVTFTNGTAKMKKANNLFRGCTKLTEVKGLDLTNCDSLKYLFMNCESLTDKIEFETNATDLSYMFMNCKSLERVWLSVPNINIATGMFTGCEALREVEIYSVCSFSVLFNELPAVESGILYLNNDYYDTVSAETKAIAQNKGWTVKQATFLHP